MSWRETSLYLYLCTASLYLCTASLYLEKVVASKQLKFAMETDVERKARLEKMVATTQLRLALEMEEERRAKKEFIFDIKIFFFSRTELARPVMGAIFLVIVDYTKSLAPFIPMHDFWPPLYMYVCLRLSMGKQYKKIEC